MLTANQAKERALSIGFSCGIVFVSWAGYSYVVDSGDG